MSPPPSSLNLPHLPSRSGEQKVEEAEDVIASSIISSPTSVSKSSSSSSSGNHKCESSLADRRTNANNNAAFSSDSNVVEVEAPPSDIGNVETKDNIARSITHSTSERTIPTITRIPKIATVAAPATSSSCNHPPSSFPKIPSSNPTPTTTTTNTTAATTRRGYVSAPMIYVTITLRRNPSKVRSWGLVFTKERRHSTLAYIIRVTTPPAAEGEIDGGRRPIVVTHCRMTNSAQYAFEDDMYTEYVLPGDGIYSINGMNISSFATTYELASYIRKECTTRITLVIVRHEYVRRAVNECRDLQIERKDEPNDDHNDDDDTDDDGGSGSNSIRGMVECCVSRSVNNAWRCVLAPITNNNDNSNQLLYSSTSNGCCNRPTTNTTTGAMKRPREDEIEVDGGDDDTAVVVHDFWIANGHATFGAWHEAAKSRWAKSYTWNNDKIDVEEGESNAAVVHDFWLVNNNQYDSFQSWHATSKAKWARSYSWHKTRRDEFQMKCEREVHFPTVVTTATTSDHTTSNNNTLVKFENWLGVRKNQWRLERRKRRRLLRAVDATPHTTTTNGSSTISVNVNNNNSKMQPTTSFVGNVNDMYIDDMIRDQEQHASLDSRTSSNSCRCYQPIDILWIFDSRLGAPDDVIANLMTYLNPCDHGSLLCLSSTTNTLFKQRNDMWRALFPLHWIVPRRPRRSWCTMYITRIRTEEGISRKRSDTVLLRANVIIDKGDQLHKMETLIRKAMKEFDFSINYTSGVVLECNSILNLSVIARRHKITKWLIETKGADVESFDRGGFTPLMNAAWNGDKYITRYLLSKKCDRTKVGYYHSSKGIAPPSFEGLTAEGWACKCGHDDVAELIRLGL